MNLVEALLQALEERGAGEIFGIPGDFALPFFRIVEESGRLPLFTLSHEPAVGFAADAAARLRGTLGVAAVTYGAGAFNLVNAVAGAYAEKSPVVVISGAPGTREGRSGLLLHHQGKTLDTQYRVFAEITCAQARLDDAASAPAEIARVLDAAAAQSRPVYLEIPRDMVGVEIGSVPPPRRPPCDAEAVAACADAIMARLASATQPVLMVDVEVRRFGLEARVAELARRLAVPVVTSFMGRGLLAGADAPLAGTYLGVAGDPALADLVEGSDALVLLGVILCDTNFGVSAGRLDLRRTVQALDGQVAMGFHVWPGIPLPELVDALLQRARPLGATRGPAMRPAAPRGLVADEAPIGPMDIARGINDLFDRHGPMPIAADTGDCLFTAMDIEHTDLVAPGYYAGMGFGVPAGIGAQLATGRRTLILVGDGAFQMTGWELGNCRRLGIDPLVIVFNNRSWEMLRAFQPQSRFNDLDDWRFAEAAAALGGSGRRVATRRELAEALEEAAAARGGFRLVEAMIPRGVVSATLERFVEGVQRLQGPR
ncbi:indolepyruvate/phenylpyruvate decarboxylase [Marinimicrococcus flavescens]|uniref:Indolepyruvate/phenylpyruvate decarboxylase n=1 Tax=Marinimicrococcus flavescens TaxID=3031815 RepID=A0AAP3UZ45_9PROT|nr:indolepyruvate/phenylpyruvate decarboxylase [Marinimicrococcus flavescens]